MKRDQIGQPCLWDWIVQQTKPLSDADFFGHWRGWLGLDSRWEDWRWQSLAPDDFENVPALAPPNGCRWISDPLD